MECPFELPVKTKEVGTLIINGEIVFDVVDNRGNSLTYSKEDADYIIQAINSHEKFKTYKTERENIFTLLNEKQLSILGGMCLDSIIRNLVKQFERRQAFIEEHDECEAYREYEVFCNEQELKQSLESEKKKCQQL